ncbi:MAG TPA: SCO family protein [Chryseobacterium sp.]|nr:SCO family protein [Chryseobacterium sp.]
MKNIIVWMFLLLLTGCAQENKQEEKPLEESIFLLESNWQNQDGKTLKLRDLKGKNLVVTMIFTRCETACPLLVKDMQQVKAKLDKKHQKETDFILVSVDPENDTPEVLKAYAQKNNLTDGSWTLLRSNTEDTRELANVLATKYKQITPIVFSHSNIITVFNKQGEMVSQAEGTVKDEEVAATVNQLP